MNRILLALAGVALIAATDGAQAQTQETSTAFGPVRFGVTAGPAGNASDPFGTAARFEKDNPMNRMPWDGQANAAPTGAGPSLGAEGSGTPMSRGGINDTLTGANAGATFNATPVTKPKAAKQADKSKAQGAAPKP